MYRYKHITCSVKYTRCEVKAHLSLVCYGGSGLCRCCAITSKSSLLQIQPLFRLSLGMIITCCHNCIYGSNDAVSAGSQWEWDIFPRMATVWLKRKHRVGFPQGNAEIVFVFFFLPPPVCLHTCWGLFRRFLLSFTNFVQSHFMIQWRRKKKKLVTPLWACYGSCLFHVAQ